jgi:hypothetical protein
VEPQAQLACFGAIDDALPKCGPDTIKMVEAHLPGSTRPGRRGWYGELRRFLARNADRLGPVADVAPESVALPDFPEAVAMVLEEPRQRVLGNRPLALRDPDTAGPIEDCAGNATAVIRASTVINKMVEMEHSAEIFGDQAAEALSFDGGVDPLAMVVNRCTALPEDTSVEVATRLRAASSRTELNRTLDEMINADPGAVSVTIADHYQARLRRTGGRWSSILSSDWQRPELTLEHFKQFIEPRNWHLLCGFFADMQWNPPRTSNGWIRILEVVSPDPADRWMLKTTLRYWKQETADGGICINYDLAEVRDPNDSRLVDTDNGYLWITNLDPDDPSRGVRIRASKELRIRGLSPTATAALGVHTGWPDAAAQLLTAHAEELPKGCIEFGPTSPVDEPTDADGALCADPRDGDCGDSPRAVEVLEFPDGWRNALLTNGEAQAAEAVTILADLAEETARTWDDGITPRDIADLGARWATELTDFAVTSFEKAINTVRPASEE